MRRALRRPVAALSSTLLVAAVLTACSDPAATDATGGSGGSGGSESGSASSSAGGARTPDSTGTPSPASDAVVVDVTFDGDSVEPNGERIQVDRGQEVDLVVTADEAGEIHVHSSPEQELEYDGGGEPQTFTMTFDRPGIVEVESHTLDQQIVSLEVG